MPNKLEMSKDNIQFEAQRLAEVLSLKELKESLLVCLKNPKLAGFLSLSAGKAYFIKLGDEKSE